MNVAPDTAVAETTAVSKPQTFVLFLGIQYLGAVAVPTDKAGLPEGEISLYESAGASLLLTTLKMRNVPEGMKVITQKEFFAIVKHLAGKYPQISLTDEELFAEANKWELSHGGISGRTAQQFINYLAGMTRE